MEFTQEEIERMKRYEERTSQRVVYTFEEKCELYRKHNRQTLENAARGMSQSIYGRMNFDNQDSFDEPDDGWKLKILKDNLEAVKKVLEEMIS
ncbi:MAG: hypothetical protein WCI72_02895 [archaeon]